MSIILSSEMAAAVAAQAALAPLVIELTDDYALSADEVKHPMIVFQGTHTKDYLVSVPATPFSTTYVNELTGAFDLIIDGNTLPQGAAATGYKL